VRRALRLTRDAGYALACAGAVVALGVRVALELAAVVAVVGVANAVTRARA
jgi:hypothetical protein